MSIQVPSGKGFIPQESNKSQTPQEGVKKDEKAEVEVRKKRHFGPIDAGLMDTYNEQVLKIDAITKEVLLLRKDLLEEKTLTSEQKKSLSHILKNLETFVQSHESLQVELMSIKDQLAYSTLTWSDSTAILQKQRGIEDKIQQLQKRGEEIVAHPELSILKNVHQAANSAQNQYDALFSKYEAKQEFFLKNHQKMTNQGYIEGCFHQLKEEISGFKNIGIKKETGNFIIEEKSKKIARLQKEIQFQIDHSGGEKLSRTTILQHRVRDFFSSKKSDASPLFLQSTYTPQVMNMSWNSSPTVGFKHALNEMASTEKTFREEGLKKAVTLLDNMIEDKKIRRNPTAYQMVKSMHARHQNAFKLSEKLSKELERVIGNDELTDREKTMKLIEIYHSPLFERYVAALDECTRNFQPAETKRLVDIYLRGKEQPTDQRPYLVQINDELIKPIQRLTRHENMLKEFLKTVPAGTEEYKSLSETLTYVHNAALLVNERLPVK